MDEFDLIEKEFRHEVMVNKELYPHLYDDEIKKNRYKMYGYV